MSIPNIKIIKWLEYKIIQTSAILKERISLMRYIFVDNTDLTIGKLYTIVNDIDKVLRDIQKALDK